MSSIITKLFKGSCPSYPEGQTNTVPYDNNGHKVVSTACPVEVTISTIFN